MEKILNCPNCGAPITGPRCEYCGTTFEDVPRQAGFYMTPERFEVERLKQARLRYMQATQTSEVLVSLSRFKF